MNTSQTSKAPQWLVVSDIDDTLTGDAQALAELAHALKDAGDRVKFAVNSSRPAASVAATLVEEFPENLTPHAVITALGTEVSVGGNALTAWQSRFSGWPHHLVFAILAGLGHQPHDQVYQTQRKVSFAVPVEAQPEARQALAEAGIGCEIIASGQDDFDVLPKGAGKAAASRFLASHLNVDASYLVVAGDSGNDLDMFHAAPHRIAVGNARRELIDKLTPGSFYHARRHYAAGVHEGLRHFGVLPSAERNSHHTEGTLQS